VVSDNWAALLKGSGCTRRRVEAKCAGPLRYGDLQLRLALSRRRVLVLTEAEGCATAQSGNVGVSWCECGTAAIDVQESLVTLIP
jgi:hypothetical protein